MQSETEILNYLKTMKFKRSLFGVKRSDVLEKMRTLNLMYRRIQEQTEQQMTPSAEYQKKVEALVKAFIDAQEQADGIIGKATKQAEEITETAKKNAAEILVQAEMKSEQLLAQQKQENEQLVKKREMLLSELTRISSLLNQAVQKNLGGEISAQ